MVIRSAEEYHKVLKLFPPVPEPPFEEKECLERFWDKRWGANSEVGNLRTVLLHRPGAEMRVIDDTKWDESAQALICDKKSWYWRGRTKPDLDLMQRQHDGFAAILEREGVEIIWLDCKDLNRPKAVFTRDFGVAIPGGVILGRFAPLMRRGEEKNASKTLGALGAPILRTIHGTGTFEGGNFAFLDTRHAAVGYSSRTNQEGIRQIEEILRVVGIELLAVPLTGYALHLDGAFSMVDVDKALVNVAKLPYWFLEKLKELGIHTIDVHPEDNWYAINCVPVKPGKIIMAAGSDRTAERLFSFGVDVVQTEYSEILKNGGGPRCSTMPLQRDEV